MREPFIETSDPSAQAHFNIDLGENSLDAMVYYHFVYEDGDYFPSRAHITIRNNVRLIKPPLAGSTQYEEGTLEQGMIAHLTPAAMRSLHDVEENFVLKITSIDSTGKQVVAQVIQPTNVPIAYQRGSISENRDRTVQAVNMKIADPPWAVVCPILGLEAPSDIELNSQVSIIKLSEADIVELQQYVYSFHHIVSLSSILFTHAICFRTDPIDAVDTRQRLDQILTALRLFNSGFLELNKFWFVFGPRSSSCYGVNKDHYEGELPIYSLTEDNYTNIRNWTNHYHAINQDIVTGSVISRALGRFARTYDGELHDRITDAVIGLEAIVAPESAPEITYRVRQRVGFLLSDDPTDRINIAANVKKVYDVRSGRVHTATNKPADESMAQSSQELLRQAIRRILNAEGDLRLVFCRTDKNTQAKQEAFYKALINVGQFDAAIKYWRSMSLS